MPAAPDGRRARSERSRAAIVDAFLVLLPDAERRPTVEEIAAAANVSERSVYRHFPDVDTLIEAAITRRVELMAPLAVLDVDPAAPREERIRVYVEQTCEFYEVSLPLRRFTDRVREEIPAVERIEDVRRVFLRDQMTQVFAPELERSGGRAVLVQDTIEAVSSWATWRHLRTEQGCSVDHARDAIELAVTAVLGAASPPPTTGA